MAIHLKKATPKDATLIFELAEKIWRVQYIPIVGETQVNYMLDMMYSEDSLTEQMTTGHTFYIVIDNESRNIGFISVSGENDKFIHKFYINNDRQNKGVGTNVFQAIRKLYPETSVYRLTVNRQNFKAINFYFKNGFKIESVEDFDIGNGYFMNDFVMVWKE